MTIRAHGRGDRGSVSLFTVVVALGLLVAIGLVVDGGGKIRALQRANAAAGEAARQGGQAISAGPAIEGQAAGVDPLLARAAAQSYLGSAGVDGTVTVVGGGTELEVTTTTTYEPVFLSLIGVGPMTTTGHAKVRLARGPNGA